MRVFINGFGRIGRSVLRAWAQGAAPGLTIAAINDIAAPEMCAYLFEYDSVFGPWRGSVALTDGALVVDGHAIPLHRTPDISALDLTGIDLVLVFLFVDLDLGKDLTSLLSLFFRDLAVLHLWIVRL